jgi:aspartate/methionine/tyrosine aminotransferase
MTTSIHGPRLSSTAQRVRAGVFADLQARIDAHAGDLVPLQIGDTAIAPPEGAELGFSRDAALVRYGATAGMPELRAAIAARLSRRFGLVADPASEILVGCGATHALFCAARAAFDPGDEVLLASPYWPLAHGVLRSVGVEPVEVPLSSRLHADDALDAGALFEAAITPRTRGLYLITPNNPDGKILSRRQLESIAKVADAHDLWVIADEVYADYAFDAPHVSFATLPAMASRTITAGSLSKSHALAGARVGYVAAPAPLVAAARRVSVHTVFNVPVASQRAALAALADDAWVEAARVRYREARDAVVAALSGTPARFSAPEGGTYVFLDFTELLGDRPLKHLLERGIDRGVLLMPGESCGLGFERRARLCYTAAELPRVLEGVARLRRAIEDF